MSITDDVVGIITENPIGSTIGAGLIGVGIGGVVGAVIGGAGSSGNSNSSNSTRRKIKHTKRGWAQDRRLRSNQKWEVAYQRRKRRGKHNSKRKKRVGKIYYTKKGQPYKILASGKARFVKK